MREEHLDHMMEEYRNDLGSDYIPFINMIDINSNEQLPRPRPRPEQRQQTTLPHKSGRTTADIMADILLRKQQQLRAQHRISSSHLEGDEGEGGEETSRRRVRTPSPISTSAAAEQSLQASDTSIVTTTRRRHRPRTSIIITTLFSLLYFVSVFASEIDILLPSYLKSASESVHQLYGASEALGYLEHIEELAHPTAYLLEHIMSRAASDIGDVNGVLGGRPQPRSPPTSVHPSPTSPPAPLGPFDLLNKPDIIKSVSEFHIKRDASYIAPASMDIKEIYNKFEETTWDAANLSLGDIILRYFRSCLVHRNDTKIGYIVLSEKEYQRLWDNDEIKMTNVDIPMSRGYPNLYQHIHIHQQATDAINFKITSCILLGSNDKIDINWKRDYLAQRLYLIVINIAADEPRTRNILRSYRRDSSQHQEFKLNQPTSHHRFMRHPSATSL